MTIFDVKIDDVKYRVKYKSSLYFSLRRISDTTDMNRTKFNFRNRKGTWRVKNHSFLNDKKDIVVDIVIRGYQEIQVEKMLLE